MKIEADRLVTTAHGAESVTVVARRFAIEERSGAEGRRRAIREMYMATDPVARDFFARVASVLSNG